MFHTSNPLVDRGKRCEICRIAGFTPNPLRCGETGLVQHAKVLADRLARDRQIRCKCRGSHRPGRAQLLNNVATGWVSKSGKNAVGLFRQGSVTVPSG